MDEEFTHDRDAREFRIQTASQVLAVASYHLTGEVADFDHTEVPSEFRGRGLAGRVVRQAMDAIRAEGAWKVRPVCSYVVDWFDKHPDYADLLA